MKKAQIIYPPDEYGNDIHPVFMKESELMAKKGFKVGCCVEPGMETYLYRGFTNMFNNVYSLNPELPWVNTPEESAKTLNMSAYLDIIGAWSFPSRIVADLSEDTLLQILAEFHCDRLFIKTNSSSLFAFGDLASVFPDNNVETLIVNFKKLGLSGPFIIRKYFPDKEIFYNEQRIWVVNGQVYSYSTDLKDFIYDVAKRIYEFSNSSYFNIDIAGDYIVEINPGESSDRGGDNPLEWFCDIFANEFLNG